MAGAKAGARRSERGGHDGNSVVRALEQLDPRPASGPDWHNGKGGAAVMRSDILDTARDDNVGTSREAPHLRAEIPAPRMTNRTGKGTVERSLGQMRDANHITASIFGK